MGATTIHWVDWCVIGSYLFGLIAFSVWLSFRQFSRSDYYVGGRAIGSLPIAISTMATQCSTNSILGAPAFVAFTAGGGLLWLQYELAVPLAMLGVMILLLPVFRQLRLVSVYEYLERRFDLKTRLILSAVFQFVRAFATAVTIYSIALVIELITGLPFFWSVILLGVITLVYDIFGGVRGVIYSDVAQMAILVIVLLLVLVLLVQEAGGFGDMLLSFPADRSQTLDFSHHGLGDGQTFAFWPMLFGGFFLYVSYYGCDQSQAQRVLCAKTLDDSKQSLFLNGLLRFPLVLLYCLVGVGIGSYAMQTPGFIEALPLNDGQPNYNLVVPQYILQNLPIGVVGLALVALFAAAMSSLDSVINSLSASTMEDFVRRFYLGNWSDEQELWISRLITLIWGTLALCFSFYVGDISDSVLVAINKIGSLINGPVLGVFILGVLTKRATGTGATVGLLTGFITNLLCWLYVPGLSWLWWNVLGFIVCVVVGYGLSFLTPNSLQTNDDVNVFEVNKNTSNSRVTWRVKYALLLGYCAALTGLLWCFQNIVS